jgi:hypothetical protein
LCLVFRGCPSAITEGSSAWRDRSVPYSSCASCTGRPWPDGNPSEVRCLAAVSRTVVLWQPAEWSFALWTASRSRPASTRARPVGRRQNCGTGRRLSTALIDDLLDERFAANSEQVTQPRLMGVPLGERTGAPAPSCQTNGHGYTTPCTHLPAPKRTARPLRPTPQELKTFRLEGT